MNYLLGIEGYMTLYGYYIGDIQGFLIYSTYHQDRTEEEWKSLEWTEEYELFEEAWAKAGYPAREEDDT